MNKLSGLDARIMNYLFDNDLQSFKYIKEAFRSESSASIQAALDRLCERGLIAHYENVIFKPYATLVSREAVELDL